MSNAQADGTKFQVDQVVKERLRFDYFQRLMKERVEEIVKGRPSSPKGKMLQIAESGGVLELWSEDNRIDGALHTDEGHITFEGGRLTNGCQPTTGSSAVPGACTDLTAQLRKAIMGAFDKLAPFDAIKQISHIWGELDQVAELAAARIAILAAKVPTPNLGEIPEWFKGQRDALLKSGEGIRSDALKCAELLVRSLPKTSDNYEAEVEVGPSGRVSLDWILPRTRMQWLVEGVDQRWPIVKVYCVTHRKDGLQEATVARIFRDAYSVSEFYLKNADAK